MLRTDFSLLLDGVKVNGFWCIAVYWNMARGFEGPCRSDDAPLIAQASTVLGLMTNGESVSNGETKMPTT